MGKTYGVSITLILALGALGCDDPRLRADEGFPTIVIETPERADTIQATGDHTIIVRGQAAPVVGALTGVTVATRHRMADWVDLASDGRFEVPVEAHAGLNVVIVEAQNTRGRTTRAVRAFHYAPAYFDPQAGTAPAKALLHARLTDWALDWGSPEDRVPYDPCAFDPAGTYRCPEIRDLASLFELALNQVDFSALQPVEQVSLPLYDQTWTLNLIDFAEVRVRLAGTLEATLSVNQITVGEAKVLKFASTEGGADARIRFGPHSDAQGGEQPGLAASVSLEATLHLGAWLDVASDDPDTQDTLCNLANILCNIFPPYDCLDEYLESCTPAPTPLASTTSGLDAPVLGSLAAEQMWVDVSLGVGLEPDGHSPKVELRSLDLDLALGALDLSAFEDVTVDLGTVQVAGYDIDLGSFHLPHTFLSDVIDFLTDLLLNAIAPLVEPVLGELFSCEEPENPICLVVPFIEDMLSAFAVSGDLAIQTGPGGPPVLVELSTRLDGISFVEFHGGTIELAARLDGPQSESVTSRRDDDFLGHALIAGCLGGDADFESPPTGNRSLQLAPSLDLLNMFLLAAWEAGALDLSASHSNLGLEPDLFISNMDIELQPLLPPLLNHCAADSTPIELQLGDTRFLVDLVRADRHWVASGWVSLGLPADLDLGSDGRVELASGAAWLELEVESLEIDGQPAGGDERKALESLLRGHLVPPVVAARVDILLAELDALYPAFDITRFPGVDPADAHLTIGDLYPNVDQGRLVLNGNLVP